MAKSQGQVTKIYELKTLGYADLSKQLANVNKLFEQIKKSKLSISGKSALADGAVEVKRYSEEIEKLILEEQQLRVETQKLTNEQKAANLVRQKELDDLRKQRAGVNAAKGSYAELYAQYKQLYALVKNAPKGASINFLGNTLSYDEAIAKLKQLAAAEQDFRRQFARDGLLVGEYTSGIVQAFKKMGLGDLVAGQVTKAKQRLGELNAEFDKLQKEFDEAKRTGVGDLQAIEAQMIENRRETINLTNEVNRLDNELQGTGDIGVQITNAIGNGFKNLKGQLSSLVFGFIGLTAIINRAQQGIQEAAKASDAATDLEIQIGGTAEQTDRLNSSLRRLDTRTTVAGLQEIANVALKAGAAKENIEGVTEAFDIMKVSFGKDFGSVESGVETTVKLINIFYTDGEITKERILQIGNSIRTLANETTASVPFITDFSGRMAGLKQVANITLPDVVGLAAGFEEFKQSAEIASTVLVKVIPKLATDTAKYAEIAGLTQKAFSSLLNTNPIEALVKVSEGLVKSGKDLETISESLADSELGSGRITTIIATLGGKADIFRQRISLAGKSMQETNAISEAFEKKNNNLAASFDKLGKKITTFFESSTFQTFLAIVTAGVTFLLASLPVLITLVGLLTVNWIAQNATLIGLRAQVLLYNLAIGANLLLLNVLRLANLAYVASMFIFNGAVKLVTASLRIFGITAATAAGPVRIILTLIGIAGATLAAFARNLQAAGLALNEQNRKLKILAEVNDRATKAVGAQIGVMDGWIKIIKSSATSADTKKKALEELIKIDDRYRDAIQNDVISLDKLDKAYKAVTTSIIAQAKAQASATLTAEKQAKLGQIVTVRQRLENQFALGQELSLEGSDKEVLSEILNRNTKILKAAGFFQSPSDFFLPDANPAKLISKQGLPGFLLVKKLLIDAERAAARDVQDYFDIQQEIEKDIESKIKSGEPTLFSKFEQLVQSGGTDEQFEKLLNDVTEKRKSTNRLTKEYSALVELEKKISNIINPKDKTSTNRQSRLTGAQKDDFKDIDAIRDRLNATDEKRRIENLISEEAYLDSIYANNVNAINQKLKLLKGKNAEERKQIADLNLGKVKLEKETNDKLFDLKAKALAEQFDITVKNAQETADIVINSPDLSVSAVAKAQAQLDADKIILAAQIHFNQEMDKLEKDRNNLTRKNAEDRARDLRNINRKIAEDEKAIILAQIEDARSAGSRSVAEFDLNIDRAILLVQADKKLTQLQKQAKIRILENEREFGVLVRQVAMYKILEEEFRKAYEKGVITLEQYQEIAKKLQELQNQLSKRPETQGKGFFADIKLGFGGNIISFLRDAAKKFGKTLSQDPEIGEQLGEAIGTAIVQSYELARDVMNDYFDAEQQRIRDNLDLQLERLEMEKQQVIARAQSTEEIASIERQYEAKKKQQEKLAQDQLRRSRKSEAKLALAAELANIWASVWQLGPIFAPIAGAIFTGLALARYSMRINEINREKFEFGGQPGEVPLRGGEFKGKPHTRGGTDFSFKGKSYNAEAKELAVIRTKNAPKSARYQVAGTQMQIASFANRIGGGVDFKPGATFQKMETGGYLGESLQPPVFTGSSNMVFTSNMTEEKWNEMMEKMENIAAEQSRRIDRLQVEQVTNTVTQAQKKQVKQSTIGTL